MSDNTTLSKYLINGYNSKVEGVNLIQRLEKAIKENDRDAAIDAAISIGNEVVYFAELLGKESPVIGGVLNTTSLIRDINSINKKLEKGQLVTYGDLLSTLSDASGTVAASCALVGAEPVALFFRGVSAVAGTVNLFPIKNQTLSVSDPQITTSITYDSGFKVYDFGNGIILKEFFYGSTSADGYIIVPSATTIWTIPGIDNNTYTKIYYNGDTVTATVLCGVDNNGNNVIIKGYYGLDESIINIDLINETLQKIPDSSYNNNSNEGYGNSFLDEFPFALVSNGNNLDYLSYSAFEANNNGTISQLTYDDFQQQVSYALLDNQSTCLYMPIYSWDSLTLDPIGAFYDSQSLAYDKALSIADRTGVLVDGQGRKVTVAALQGLDANPDGVLSVTEASGLKLLTDLNENGHLDAGELNTVTSEISSVNWSRLTRGNAVMAGYETGTAQPSIITLTQPTPVNLTQAVPNSNSRTLRDTDNRYIIGYMQWITWSASQVKINNGTRKTLIGTDGNDNFDASYYKNYASWFPTPLTNFLGGGGDDSVGGSTGNDSIWGGTGNDTLYGYAGNDKLYAACRD